MTIEIVKEKLAQYKSDKVKLQGETFAAEIEAKVAEFREKTEAEYDEQKKLDLAKLDHYIAALKEIVAEDDAAKAAEAAAQTVATDPNAPKATV